MLNYIYNLPQAVRVAANNNTRHMGGYPVSAENGELLTCDRLIRSGLPSQFTCEDMKVLRDKYNLKKVIDVRTPGELAESPSLDDIPGIEYIHLDLEIQYEEIADLSRAHEGAVTRTGNHWIDLYYAFGGNIQGSIDAMERIYLYAVTQEKSKRNIRRFFDILLDTREGAVLFHCTAGKDRTGLLAALFLLSIGVKWDTCIRDYMLTNRYRKKYYESQMEAVTAITDNAEIHKGVSMQINVQEIYLQKMRLKIINEYGSVENFITEILVLTADEIRELRSLYTV